YQLGPRIGVDRIAKWARAFGLGEKTGVAVDDERNGLVPDSEWKRKRYRQPWYPGETVSISIGQGYLTVTPLQLVNMIATVANGGTLYRPRIVSKVESFDGATIREYGPEKIHDQPQTIHSRTPAERLSRRGQWPRGNRWRGEVEPGGDCRQNRNGAGRRDERRLRQD